MTDWLNKEEKMKRLSMDDIERISSFEQWKIDHCGRELDLYAGCILMAIMGLFATLAVIKSCQPVPAINKSRVDISEMKCSYCHFESRHSKLTEYFRSKNLPTDPSQLASAVLQTPYPKTLSAIAVAEKSPATSTKGGYKKRHVGVFQMSRANTKAYGKTPPDVEGQARQAAALLRDLLAEEKTLPLAVAKYAGEISTDRYSRFVMAEIQRVP